MGDAARAVEGGVLQRLEVAGEGAVGDDDPGQPLHRGHAVPAGHDGAGGEAMARGEVGPVHLRGEQDVLQGLGQGEAAGEVDLAGRLVRLALVGPFEDDFGGPRLHAGPLQQRGQGHPGPLGIADSARLPEQPLGPGGEHHPAVAGAFEHGGDGPRGERPQLVEADLERALHGPLDLQPPGRRGQLGDGEVGADVELVGGGEEAVEARKRGFEVPWLGLADDERPGRRRLRRGRGLGEGPGPEQGGDGGPAQEGAAADPIRRSGAHGLPGRWPASRVGWVGGAGGGTPPPPDSVVWPPRRALSRARGFG